MKIIDIKYGSSTLPFIVNTLNVQQQYEIKKSNLIQKHDKSDVKSISVDKLNRPSVSTIEQNPKFLELSISNSTTSGNSTSVSSSCNSSSSSSSSSVCNSSNSYSRSSSIIDNEKSSKIMASNFESWTQLDVQKWVNNVCYDYDLPKPYPIDQFLMNGKGLLLLKKEDFIKRSPLCGDILYECLKNKLNKKLSVQQSTSSNVSSVERKEIKNIKTNKNIILKFPQNENEIPVKIKTTKENDNSTKRNKNFISSDYELLNQIDKNMYGYLKYLNDSFTRETSKISSSSLFNERNDFRFGLKTKKIFYQLNADQLHLYTNLNTNRSLLRVN